MLNQAFRVAVSGCPGPVHLQFKGNEGQVDQEIVGEGVPKDIQEDGMFVPPHRPLPETHSCLLYTSPSPRDGLLSRMPSSA